MRQVLDILLVIGIILNLIKGADLILRPHQQKRLQQTFESLALWLDYSRPLRFYKRARHDIRRSLFVASPFILGCFFVSTAYILGGYPLSGVIPIFAITIWLLISFIKTSAKYPDLLEETSDHRGWFAVQIVQHVLLGGISIAVVYFGVLPMLRNGAVNQMSNLEIGIRLALYFLLLPYTAGFGGPSIAVVLLSICFLLFEVGLIIVRAVVWRIVEYNKGAFAAIVLLVTVALGITELYLTFSHDTN